MPSVSTDVLTRFNFPSIVHGLAGYYVPTEGTQHVVIATSDSNIDTLHELYWKSGQGVQQDVLTHFNVAIYAGAGYYVPTDGTQHVIVWTRFGEFFEVYWKSGQGVQQDMLTGFTSGISAGFAGYYVPTEGTQHIIVGNTDNPTAPTVGIVTEVYWHSGQGVQHVELARFNGSFQVAGAYYVPDENTQHAIVITPEGNLIEMYWQSGQGVQQDVLVPQVGRRIGTAFYSADDHTQHVVLVSDDGTLTDIYWQSGQGVHQDVLTQLSSITSINEINGLTGYYSANDQKRHAIVAMPDGAVIEVYW